MNNPFQNPEEMLEEGKSLVRKTSDQAVKQTQIATKTAASQLTGDPGTNKQASTDSANNILSGKDQMKAFVKDLYAPSKPAQSNSQSPGDTQQAQLDPAQQAKEEQKKLDETREKMQAWQQQHKNTYIDPTFNRKKKPQEEEKPADKAEREEKEKLASLQLDEKKKLPPLAVTRAQSKAEKFPGASG